jgi:hypothetical protein
VSECCEKKESAEGCASVSPDRGGRPLLPRCSGPGERLDEYSSFAQRALVAWLRVVLWSQLVHAASSSLDCLKHYIKYNVLTSCHLFGVLCGRHELASRSQSIVYDYAWHFLICAEISGRQQVHKCVALLVASVRQAQQMRNIGPAAYRGLRGAQLLCVKQLIITQPLCSMPPRRNPIAHARMGCGTLGTG